MNLNNGLFEDELQYFFKTNSYLILKTNSSVAQTKINSKIN